MGRKLFCEICPLFYDLSVAKGCFIRNLKDFLSNDKLALSKQEEKLPVLIYSHQSLIRRKLGNVDQILQENKAVNLSLAAPKVNKTIIRPGETFSFWHLVGKTSAKKGYQEGLTISCGRTQKGIGGGMCQFTNLIHWMVLHSPLTVMEVNHHDKYDLFPDFKRQVPFGTGTSIMYNYLDYRFKNETDQSFQLLTWVTAEYLCGELRSERPVPNSWHIKCENEYFSKEDGSVYRNGMVYRYIFHKETGKLIKKELLRMNHARVMYDTSCLIISGPANKETNILRK